MPKQVKKTNSTRRAVTKTQSPVSSPSSSQDTAMNSILNRLSQQFNLLAVLLIGLFLFQAYTFYKLKDVEKNGVVAGAGAGAGTGQQQASPLSEDKLIAYAKDIGLNTNEFEKCLDSEEPKKIVQADTQQANDLQVFGTPGFFVNGKFLGGAFPFEYFKEIIDKEIDGTATGQCTDYSEELQGACSDPEQRNFVTTPVDVAIGDAPLKGNPNAKVTIVEFSDFECPFCARAYPTVKQIMETYPNDVKFYYKQLPLTSLHPNAQRAAEASVCAQKQGKFWEYHDKLFESQNPV